MRILWIDILRLEREDSFPNLTEMKFFSGEKFATLYSSSSSIKSESETVMHPMCRNGYLYSKRDSRITIAPS